MSEENLSDLLERAADGHAVGVPPLDQMLVRSRRARRGRAGLLAVAASVVVGSVIAGTTLLVGHDDSRQPSPANTPPSKQIILDGKWRVVALKDEEGKSLLRSDKVRLIFKAGKVGGSTECNGFGGPYRQSGPDGQDLFIPNRIGSTLVGCNETPFSLRLPAVRHVTESNGVLFLRSENMTNIATLVRVGEPVVLGGSWKLGALIDANGRSVPTARLADESHITFSDGQMSGTTECNLVSRKYEQSGIDGRDLTFPRLGESFAGCNLTLLNLRLHQVRHVSEANGNLYLQDENWATIATLERVGALIEPMPYPTIPPAGDLATWTLAPGQDLTEYSTEFTALVTRMACHDGVTGDVLGPAVVFRQDEIVVSFTAAKPASDNNQVFNCQGNDSVPVVVHLDHPLGGSKLIDGQCSEVPKTSPCYFDHGVRWPNSAR